MAKTTEHQQHIAARIAHSNCDECIADNQRSFVPGQWPGYQHVHDYLIAGGERFVSARVDALGY